MVRALRLVAALEATTLLVLLGAVVVYRSFEGEDLTSTIGPIHGTVFVAYAALAVNVGVDHNWSAKRIAAVVFAAVIPAGGYFVSDWLTRRLHRSDLFGRD